MEHRTRLKDQAGFFHAPYATKPGLVRKPGFGMCSLIRQRYRLPLRPPLPERELLFEREPELDDRLDRDPELKDPELDDRFEREPELKDP